jgi:hypothetical protein
VPVLRYSRSICVEERKHLHSGQLSSKRRPPEHNSEDDDDDDDDDDEGVVKLSLCLTKYRIHLHGMKT